LDVLTQPLKESNLSDVFIPDVLRSSLEERKVIRLRQELSRNNQVQAKDWLLSNTKGIHPIDTLTQEIGRSVYVIDDKTYMIVSGKHITLREAEAKKVPIYSLSVIPKSAIQLDLTKIMPSD